MISQWWILVLCIAVTACMSLLRRLIVLKRKLTKLRTTMGRRTNRQVIHMALLTAAQVTHEQFQSPQIAQLILYLASSFDQKVQGNASNTPRAECKVEEVQEEEDCERDSNKESVYYCSPKANTNLLLFAKGEHQENTNLLLFAKGEHQENTNLLLFAKGEHQENTNLLLFAKGEHQENTNEKKWRVRKTSTLVEADTRSTEVQSADVASASEWYERRLAANGPDLAMTRNEVVVPEEFVHTLPIVLVPCVLSRKVSTISEMMDDTVDLVLIESVIHEMCKKTKLNTREREAWKSAFVSEMQYMFTLVSVLEQVGYKREVDLFVRGYELERDTPQEWAHTLPETPFYLVSHSIGSVYAHCATLSHEKAPLIKKWIALCPVFAGSALVTRPALDSRVFPSLSDTMDAYHTQEEPRCESVTLLCGTQVPTRIAHNKMQSNGDGFAPYLSSHCHVWSTQRVKLIDMVEVRHFCVDDHEALFNVLREIK